MSIYMIDIPNCPMVMMAPDIGTAKAQCREFGVDPDLVREPTESEMKQHKEIQAWLESLKSDDPRTESKREGREL